MQFRGALRSPGDRGPGVEVLLVVDEYHLEIQRGNELIGRWYLADVEVVRDIAERFVLFLGDDEMEFLAEDALQFAYDGVTAMQNAWLRAQKGKRRHRRAAADAARRKDETPALDDPTLDLVAERADRPARPPRPAATSELARRLAASASAPMANTDDPDLQRRAPEPVAADPVPEPAPTSRARTASTGKQSLSARRKKVATDTAAEPIRVETEPSPINKRVTRAKTEATTVETEPSPINKRLTRAKTEATTVETEPSPINKRLTRAKTEATTDETEPSLISKRLTRAKTQPTLPEATWAEPTRAAPTQSEPTQSDPTSPEPTPAAPPWMAPEPSAQERVGWAEPGRPERRRIEERTKEVAKDPATDASREAVKGVDSASIHITVEPVIPPARTVRQRRARQEPTVPSPEPDLAHRRVRRLLPAPNGATPPSTEERSRSEQEPVPAEVAGDVEIRFAQEGHHPAETTTGLLSKFRKQPKLPDDHVHKFEQTGSSVGLVRRVCVECSYVSIGSDDEGSSITRW